MRPGQSSGRSFVMNPADTNPSFLATRRGKLTLALVCLAGFLEGRDRIKAIGAWSATIPLASAFGVLLGGLLSQGPGWRWVFFVNVPVCAVVLAGAFRLLD